MTTPRDNEVPYQELRPLMFSIAYRMTGSVSDAEDIVQEAFLGLARGCARALWWSRRRRTWRRPPPGRRSTT